MKIDWKHVATTEGYKSLKAAYLQDTGHSKEVLFGLFNWVICRAKYYANLQDTTIDKILDGWENGRTGWWFAYYGESKQPKVPSKFVVHVRLRGTIKQSNKWYRKNTQDRKRVNMRVINTYAKRNIEKYKDRPRWNSQHKALKRIKEYRLRHNLK